MDFGWIWIYKSKPMDLGWIWIHQRNPWVHAIHEIYWIAKKRSSSGEDVPFRKFEYCGIMDFMDLMDLMDLVDLMDLISAFHMDLDLWTCRKWIMDWIWIMISIHPVPLYIIQLYKYHNATLNRCNKYILLYKLLELLCITIKSIVVWKKCNLPMSKNLNECTVGYVYYELSRDRKVVFIIERLHNKRTYLRSHILNYTYWCSC